MCQSPRRLALDVNGGPPCEQTRNRKLRPQTWRLERVSVGEATFEPLMVLVVGVRKESWADESISSGYDKLRDLCRQFRRQESFSAATGKAVWSTVPVSLIYNDASGALVEREQFVGLMQ